jgi:hypothetical protein
MQLFFEDLVGVILALTTWPACQRGGPTAPATQHSSATSSQVVLPSATEVLVVPGSEDASAVVLDLIAFQILVLRSYLQIVRPLL